MTLYDVTMLMLHFVKWLYAYQTWLHEKLVKRSRYCNVIDVILCQITKNFTVYYHKTCLKALQIDSFEQVWSLTNQSCVKQSVIKLKENRFRYYASVLLKVTKSCQKIYDSFTWMKNPTIPRQSKRIGKHIGHILMPVEANFTKMQPKERNKPSPQKKQPQSSKQTQHKKRSTT